MDITVTQKFIKTGPKKLRALLPSFRDLSPRQALETLPFMGKRGTEVFAKVIKSALAAARQKNLSEEELVFKEIQVNEGPRLKRFRAGARGRAKPYKRRMSHIRVVLETIKQSEVQGGKDITREVKENRKLKTQNSNVKTTSKKSKL